MTGQVRIAAALGAAALVLHAGCAASGPECGPGKICTVVGSGLAGGDGDRGPATDAQLYTPQDTAVAPDGSLWVLDFNDYTVRAVDAQGIIHTVVGSGLLGDSPDPGQADCPAGIAAINHTPNMLFHDGYLYLAAWHNSRIKRVRLSDMTLENYAGIGKRTYYNGDGGPALDAAIDLPASIAFNPAGELVFLDQGNQVLRKIDPAGTITTIAGRCIVRGAGYGDTVCAEGPDLHVCPGSEKATYCLDVDTACRSSVCATGFAGDGGPATELAMAQSFGAVAAPGGRLAYDRAGSLYFADSGNNRIRKIGVDGLVSTIAGTGEPGYAGDGALATAAQLNNPVDLAFADDGTLYFTDTNNNCVRKIDPAGIIDVVAGDCTTAGQCGYGSSCFGGDGGPPTQALLDRPYGLDLDGNRLYISDTFNNRIRLVTLQQGDSQ